MKAYHISISAHRVSGESWGDLQYAQGLARELEKLGHRAEIFFAGESPALRGADDIVLRIAGPHLEQPVTGVVSMLWMITPPNLAPLGMLRRFDHAFICSQLLAEQFSDVGVAASYLPQSTEVSHFSPMRADPDKPVIPVVFVGNNATRVDRKIVYEVARAGLGLKVWGEGWDGELPEGVLMGERLDYDELAEVYARARVVLNSQMFAMKKRGMMANRCFDALASGAEVLSELVAGFEDAHLEGAVYFAEPGKFAELLKTRLAQPEASFDERMVRHQLVNARYSFAVAAREIDRRAEELLQIERTRPKVECGRGATAKVAIMDRAAPGEDWQADIVALREALGRGGVALDVSLTNPRQGRAGTLVQEALLETARAILRLSDLLEMYGQFAQRDVYELPAGEEGEIHALMPDLRAVQGMLLSGEVDEVALRLIKKRAQIALDVIEDRGSPFSLGPSSSEYIARVQRAIRETPLYNHSPPDFSRDHVKSNVKLWPRNNAVQLKRPVGVFLHLYYAELAEAFAARLAHIDAPVQLYISTDSAQKEETIETFFPSADIRVFPNVGRDIYPKFFGFSDVYDAHDLVLHLHGKKSLHSGKLDTWLEHILDCLLPSQGEVNRIISLFKSASRLGLVSPPPFQQVLPAAHWGSNYDLARELATRMGMDDGALPGNDRLTFPVGSMFWARTEAIRPIVDLGLGPEHFPREARQNDGTIAHAIERLVGVTCVAQGYSHVQVVPEESRLFKAFSRSYKTNREFVDDLLR